MTLAPANKSAPERFFAVTLEGILPEGSRLMLDQELRIISQLQHGEQDTCRIVEQQRLTDNEWFLLVEVLQAHPYYCPLETLLSALTGRSVEKCRAQIQRAILEGVLNEVILQVRNTLSRCRIKLHPFGIDIKSILETGYVLMPDHGRKPRSRGGAS